MNEHNGQDPAASERRGTERGGNQRKQPILSGAPSLRSLRGPRNSALWGEVAALLAKGPILRDLDDE